MGRVTTFPLAALAATFMALAALALASPLPAGCGGSPARPTAPPPEYEEESPFPVAPDASSPPPAATGDGGPHLP